MTVTKTIRSINDLDAVRLARAVLIKLGAALATTNVNEVLPETLSSDPRYRSLQREISAPGPSSKKLAADHSASIARILLLQLASEPVLAALILEVWENLPKDTLSFRGHFSLGEALGCLQLLLGKGIKIHLDSGLTEVPPANHFQAEKIIEAVHNPEAAKATAEAVLDSQGSQRAAIGNPNVWQEARIRAYHPTTVTYSAPSSLIVWVYRGDLEDEVDRITRSVLAKEQGSYASAGDDSRIWIARRSQVTVVPHLPGCRVTPSTLSLQYVSDLHRVEFEVRGLQTPDTPGVPVSRAGRVEFFVGPHLVGEIGLTYAIAAEHDGQALRHWGGTTFSRIFCSYSRKDTDVVEVFERYHDTVGKPTYRDVRDFHAGQDWKDRMQACVQASDIFQLFWSENASRSDAVELEWRYAWGLGRKDFVRPLVWETPHPPLPDALANANITYKQANWLLDLIRA